LNIALKEFVLQAVMIILIVLLVTIAIQMNAFVKNRKKFVGTDRWELVKNAILQQQIVLNVLKQLKNAILPKEFIVQEMLMEIAIIIVNAKKILGIVLCQILQNIVQIVTIVEMEFAIAEKQILLVPQTVLLL